MKHKKISAKVAEQLVPIVSSDEAVGVRKALGLTQTQFWSRVGVTQSGGSEYEKRRRLPDPLVLSLSFVYGSPEVSNDRSDLAHSGQLLEVVKFRRLEGRRPAAKIGIAQKRAARNKSN